MRLPINCKPVSRIQREKALIRTSLVGSSDGCFARLGALLVLLLVADVAGGGGALGSMRLHDTPCRAQFEHGFSSSHCLRLETVVK